MTLPKGWKKPNNEEPLIDRIRDTEHKRWLIGQIQYLFQTISKSRETDRLDIENRAEQYKSSMFGTRDKILAGVAFFATILL